jgi:hypothetical protein
LPFNHTIANGFNRWKHHGNKTIPQIGFVIRCQRLKPLAMAGMLSNYISCYRFSLNVFKKIALIYTNQQQKNYWYALMTITVIKYSQQRVFFLIENTFKTKSTKPLWTKSP